MRYVTMIYSDEPDYRQRPCSARPATVPLLVDGRGTADVLP